LWRCVPAEMGSIENCVTLFACEKVGVEEGGAPSEDYVEATHGKRQHRAVTAIRAVPGYSSYLVLCRADVLNLNR